MGKESEDEDEDRARIHSHGGKCKCGLLEEVGEHKQGRQTPGCGGDKKRNLSSLLLLPI
jgi:hypothetical protein